MTQIEQIVQHSGLEQRMETWGNAYKTSRRDLNSLARTAYAFHIEWYANGSVGDFSTLLAQHSGLSRTTAWRQWRCGMALANGADPDTDQTDLLHAARALDNGADVADVNEALKADKIKDLADQLSVGTVGRSMDSEVAELRDKVLERLGTFGMEGIKPKEREAIVYHAFLVVPDDALAALVRSYRTLTENTDE